MQNTKIGFSANLEQIESALKKQQATKFCNCELTGKWIDKNGPLLKEILSGLPEGISFSLERGVNLTGKVADEFVPAAKRLQDWSNETASDFLLTKVIERTPQGKFVERKLGVGNPDNTNGFQLKSVLEEWGAPNPNIIET